MKKAGFYATIASIMVMVNVGMSAEINVFENSQCTVELQLPDSSTETIRMTGSSVMEVLFAGTGGATTDSDGNGRDDVNTQMTAFDFAGVTMFGPVHMQLNASAPTNGLIEEQVNNTPGVLDIPPFAETGTCDSFFDVFVEVTIAGLTLHNFTATLLSGVIAHAPPEEGSVYQNSSPTPLYDENGNPTGLYLTSMRYKPNPPTEVDVFEYTRCQLELTAPDGSDQTVQMAGRSIMRVFFDGSEEGSA